MQLFLAFFVSLSITALLIPVLERLAPAIGLNDAPGPRKVHSTPVPRVGGIAMALGILAAVLIGTDLGDSMSGVLAGMLVLLAFGVWDDRTELDYRIKFVGQILAVGVCLAISDVRIESITLDVRYPLPEPLSFFLTAAFLIGVTNAVNLSDGLDGLAGGMALLCCCGIALLALSGGDLPVVAVALIIAGAILGFLRYNTHPARVFMGDAGSQLLGFATGVLAISATQGEATAVSAALPLLLIGVPILDTLRVMWIRIRAGRSPFAADRNHLHHRLLALGFRHGEAVFAVYLLQAGLFLLAYFMRFESDLAIVVVYSLVAATALGCIGIAHRSAWRARDGEHRAGIAVWADRIRQSGMQRRLPEAAGLVALVAMSAYALGVVATAPAMNGDIALLAIGMLLLLAMAALGGDRLAAIPLDRAVAYTAAVTIVFLDQSRDQPFELFAGQNWALLVLAALAMIVRTSSGQETRFRATTLDGLVLFLAVVVPQLPGPLQFADAFGDGLSKAVILLYSVELWLACTEKRRTGGLLLAAALATVAVRALPAVQL